MSITPKNWDNFQHYKDRSPAWIKLHRGLLDDFTFARLPVASRALAPLLWLLASEYTDGKITASTEELAFRLRMSHDEMIVALSPLIESGFFNASEPLAPCKQDACPEKRREEDIEKRERKKFEVVPSSDFEFEDFWRLWPAKVGKRAALKAFVSARRRASLDTIVEGVYAYIRDKPPDRHWMNPATFLNGERWTDQPATVSISNGKPKNGIIQAADDLRRKLASFDGPSREPDELRSGEGGNPVRLLSNG